MSKVTYKRLGDYIREVNVRNRELKITNLLEVDIKELLVREYEQFLLSKIKN